MQPTLIIGLGGTGAYVLAGVWQALQNDQRAAAQVGKSLHLLYIDTDTRFPVQLQLPEHWQHSIGFYALPYILDACQHDENLKEWFDCEILRYVHWKPDQFDLSRSTAMYRQFGRLALFHDLASGNHSRVRRSIHQALSTIQQHNPDPPLIILCASLIGGTGSALLLDVAYLVRQILAKTRNNPHDGDLLAVCALHDVFTAAVAHGGQHHHIRFIMNQVAAIKEIRHYSRNRYEFGPKNGVIAFESIEPFNTYWLYGTDQTRWSGHQWPTDHFTSIADDVANVIRTDVLVLQPNRPGIVDTLAPLETNIIRDWGDWNSIYERHISDDGRLSPHISREFCR